MFIIFIKRILEEERGKGADKIFDIEMARNFSKYERNQSRIIREHATG